MKFKILGILLCGIFAHPASAVASYREDLRQLLETHRLMIAAKFDIGASEEQLEAARGGWYPNVRAITSYGVESRAGAHFQPNSNDILVDQLLWNFGATNASIKKADLGLEQTNVTYETSRQDLLLEGLTAYINLFRAYRTLEFAQKSVDNIRKQTGMEQSRVELGSGLPTDVLQAKSQLAGVLARQARAEGALAIAENRYRNVFSREPPREVQEIPPPIAELPANLDLALQLARERNYALRVAQLGTQIAHTEVERVRSAGLFPEIRAVGQTNFRNDANGIRGQWNDYLIRVEMNYSLNLGFSQVHAVDAANSTARAYDYRLQDTLMRVEEQVRNAWNALQAARHNAELLKDQASIVAEFLRLAREERLLGKRSLIDVLVGETNLINAESDALSADADVAIATFSLLKSVSSLEWEVLRE